MKTRISILLLALIAGVATAQKTEALMLIGSYSASNGGLHFSNSKGDTMFYCPNHPDECMDGSSSHSLYETGGGPGLDSKYKGKKFLVTYTVDDPTMTDNGDGLGITATVTKMLVATDIAPKPLSAEETNKLMADIEKQADKIKASIPQLKQIVDTDNGHDHTNAYADGKELRYVSVFFKNDSISTNYDYYYSNREMIYALQLVKNFKTGVIKDYEKMYVHDSHPIAWVKTGNVRVDPNSDDFKQMTPEMEHFELEQVHKYAQMLNK